MSTIEEIEMMLDQKGNVIPSEQFSGNGKKNYIAQIMGRDPKYTWRRQWLQKIFTMDSKVSRYAKAAFIVGEVYEVHSSFLPTPTEETEMQKRGKFDKEQWRKDRMNRINSKYNGFWKVTHVMDDRIKLSRMYDGDMYMVFPKDGVDNDYQTALSDFTKGEDHIL